MRKLVTVTLSLALVGLLSIDATAEKKKKNKPAPHVEIALLLDTSNSMDGLIAQAKSELWKIVNELISSKQDGQQPILRVALYEYGKSSLPLAEGHIRQIAPLSRDLDRVSEELFKLTTNGGNEFCGHVIQRAVDELEWSGRPEDLKMIVIAGNEPFSQGKVSYHTACKAAITKGIMVNTIHCGNGIPEGWRNGAMLADGRSMNINQNRQVVHIPAPQDKAIAQLGVQLNKTYLPFGKQGQGGWVLQQAQDSNASKVSLQSAVQRAVCKANSFYCNTSWDLVDAVKEGKVDLAKLKKEELPEPLRDLKPKQREEYVADQLKKRTEIQAKINELNKNRAQFVKAKTEELQKDSKEKTLDQVIAEAIRVQAKKRNFTFNE